MSVLNPCFVCGIRRNKFTITQGPRLAAAISRMTDSDPGSPNDDKQGVNVKPKNGGWVCSPPGHGSEFALNGALKTGVASSGLRSINFVATTKAVTIA